MPKKPKTFFETELDRIYREHTLRAGQYVRVRQSKAFMEKYYAEKIELDSLAAAASLSRFHYIRVFQRMYGLTPRTYLRDLRITKAKALIRKGISITQACFEVGYDSAPTFSLVFKRCTGYGPREYQRLHKRNLE